MSAPSSSQALEYLQGLPLQTHRKLYEAPATVLAVFRCMLPHLAKTLVMAMLYMPTSFPESQVNAWFKPGATREKSHALFVLAQLHILDAAKEDDGRKTYSLSPGFKRSLRHALEGSGRDGSFGVSATAEESRGERRVSIEYLDEHARAQWETILFYMVGGAAGVDVKSDMGAGTKKLLHAGDLVRTWQGQPRITKEGFTFVLQETNAQVWNLLIVYLRMVNDLGMNETDVLSFLFMLGSLELGQAYSTSTLTATQLQMLDDLSAMGIVFRSSKDAKIFYPTRLATTLTSESGGLNSSSSSSSTSSSSSASQGFIIIETNYRLYAYTSSLIQMAIISLFCKLQHRFPNLISGKLTKESVHRAVAQGITSAQIISYLTTHAHPQMQKNTTFLPPTVMDQIRLWEYEGERVETETGYLMREFGSLAEYRDVKKYADECGVLKWSSDEKRMFFITHVEQVSAYLKSRKAPR
ncbi:RNA polymerase II transcription factor B subunit 2 [Didymella exigua CBS 183.55]|uniref:RNA polymerase II transcription factor B subunit 2 n=1 Tax=Didymella exigua CBS 183.55 TaxID=1150837 RepID=A0A6A5RWI6_9PLEO|nr:RNA polymerase II transcription factor B subunit 2 [Didymella exigua CBS 183.55]KAF1932761.1 RNA polymerase II transcription factor B subunit 2 [Didymella exigua CBS 183.55]